MKLPTFQAQKGTSMASAMTSPAQVGQIKQRVAVTKPLVGVRNVQGELNLGTQRAKTSLMVGKLISDASLQIVDITNKVNEANNTAAQEAASAERTNFAAALATDLKINATKLDADGNRGFEVAEREYTKQMDAFDERNLNKYRFSGAKAESKYKVTKATEDRTFIDTIKVWANDEKIKQTKAYNEVTLMNTRSPEKVKEIVAGGIHSGLYSPGEGQKILVDWQTNMIETDAVVAIEGLRSGAPFMSEGQFQNSMDVVVTGIMNSQIPLNPEVQRKLLKDASDLRIDFEERIMGQNEDRHYGNWNIRYMDAKLAGDPKEITQIENEMREPAAIERFGESNYIQMVKVATTGGTAKFTTPEARMTMSAMIEDIRDGLMPAIEGSGYLIANYDKFKREDYDQYYKAANTVQDPLVTKARGDARFHSNMLFVKTADPSVLSFEAQQQKASNISTAYQVSEAVKDRIDMWARGEMPGPMPDVRTMVYEAGAQYYEIKDFMVTSSGARATNIWDVDLNKSRSASEEKFATDTRKSMRTKDNQDRLSDLSSLEAMLRRVPTKPEGM